LKLLDASQSCIAVLTPITCLDSHCRTYLPVSYQQKKKKRKKERKKERKKNYALVIQGGLQNDNALQTVFDTYSDLEKLTSIHVI
jgi:hypothetical protein